MALICLYNLLLRYNDMIITSIFNKYLNLDILEIENMITIDDQVMKR